MNLKSVGFLSAIIYTTISLVIAGIFLAATLLGDYNWIARIGGACWVFLLSMIVFMPLITSQVKKKQRG
ncbi:MAG: hypothetical protein PHR56_05895 [Dehalococcoidales bacterium]|nr:hypothetical protein [Dehalococcoidales bacterium]